jgi:hypothetical protein
MKRKTSKVTKVDGAKNPIESHNGGAVKRERGAVCWRPLSRKVLARGPTVLIQGHTFCRVCLSLGQERRSRRVAGSLV